MAFVNLPPSLQDIFYSITDRIAKLETGPNQAMYTAEYAQEVAESAQGGSLTAQTTAAAALAQSTIAQAEAASAQAVAASANTTASLSLAQSTIAQAQAISAQATAASANTAASTASAQATEASAQAVTAQATANTAYLQANVASAQAIIATNTANAAASQATIAQSQATIASSQATAAQVSADGKNKVYYSTSAPGATANQVGDIWYQYGTTGTYANKVIAQFSGAGGTSWTPVTVSGLVIANIDAGSITTGTLSAIQISAGAGGTQFTVSPGGYMMAQGAYIKGNITADSGTFNGQINATSGYFGSPTNGWQINAGGIAGLGTGYISGGTIQGTNFNNGNGTFFVNSAGAVVAQSLYAQGVIRATSGFFGSAGTGWQIDTNGITGLGSGYIAGGQIQGTTFTNGNGTFFVNAAGQMYAQSVFAQGVIRATSGYFGSASAGWQIDSAGITGLGSGYIAGGAIQGTTFNNNNGTFSVNAAGALVAQNVYVKGAVLGTSGYFGNATNGWQIDTNGITGIGSGYIAGGAIQGTSFNNGNGTFFVNSSGQLVAQSVYVKGAIAGTSGYFGNISNGWNIDSTGITGIGSGYIAGGQIQGTTFNNGSGTFQVSSAGAVTATSGTIGGFTLASTYLSGAGGFTLNSNGQIDGGSGNTIFYGKANIGGGTAGTESLIVTGASNFNGTITGTSLVANGTITYPGIATGAGSTMVVVTTGSRVAYTTSSERFKQDIQYINTNGWLDKVLSMKPITYKTSEDFTTEGEPNETQIGFLAEDIHDIGGGLETAVVLDPLGDPFSLAYDRLTVFLMLAIKELKAEIDTLKQQNTTNS